MKFVFQVLILSILSMSYILGQDQELIKQPYAVSINIGSSVVDGDVDCIFTGGRTVAVGLVKPLTERFSASIGYQWTRSRGLGTQPAYTINDTYWIPAFENHGHSLDLIVSYDMHIPTTPFTIGAGIGVGLTTTSTRLNFLNNEGITYIEANGWVRYFVNESPSFQDPPSYNYTVITYDNTYETEAFQKNGLFNIGDNSFLPTMPIELRLLAEINDRIDIGITFQARVSDNDYLDGIKYLSTSETISQPTNSNDIHHNYTVTVIYGLGW